MEEEETTEVPMLPDEALRALYLRPKGRHKWIYDSNPGEYIARRVRRMSNAKRQALLNRYWHDGGSLVWHSNLLHAVEIVFGESRFANQIGSM